MGLLDKIGGAVLTALFVFTFLMFGYGAQVENGVNDTILDDEHFTGVNDTFFANLTVVQDDATAQRKNIEKPQEDSSDSFGLTTLPAGIFKYISMMFSSFNLVATLLENVTGFPSIVFNVIQGLLVITVVVLGWRAIKVGGT